MIVTVPVVVPRRSSNAIFDQTIAIEVNAPGGLARKLHSYHVDGSVLDTSIVRKTISYYYNILCTIAYVPRLSVA
jgi:hypothetical protein